MIKVLFVCHGNICRSIMAEYICRMMIEERGLEQRVQAESAATSTEELGNPIYPPARRTLAAHGVPMGDHRSRQIRREDYRRYDRIIGMDRWNMQNMLRVFGGDPEGKLQLLSAYGSWEGDVADPWYSGDFELTYRQVTEGCRGLLDALTKELAGNRGKGKE